MKAFKHPSNNFKLVGPGDIEGIDDLHITRVQWPSSPGVPALPGIIVYYEPSAEDIAAILAGKKLAISFLGAHTIPPMRVEVES